MKEQWGHGAWSFHRVDLHRTLGELAAGVGDTEAQATATTPVEIRLGCEVRGVDCERGVLSMADGTVVQGDLVVIADGAHSRLISDFVGRPTTAQPTGRSVYRWLVSMDEVMADAELRGQYEGKLPGFLGWHDQEKRVLWVSYTCRGGRVLNNAIMHDTEAGEGEDDLWHSSASKEQVLKTLVNFHPTALKIVHMASEDGIKVHRLFKRPPLDSFVRGRTAVVGDAAHVMIPTHAAGGGIAIESAASLEIIFRGVDGADEKTIEERLRLFDELRLPRCNLTMLASNAGQEWLLVPGVEEEIRKYYSGPLPPKGSIPWSDEFREVLFHHDEFEAAEKALERVHNDLKT
ncbi:FAD/NAD(P)-binding domain-containing protein [Biscogniauxia marginata]|nr:FAD/NAD(P)-binding domain-containing protein [Biscogniauxia marginata]